MVHGGQKLEAAASWVTSHQPQALQATQQVDRVPFETSRIIEGPGVPEVPRLTQAKGHLQALSVGDSKLALGIAERDPDSPGAGTPRTAQLRLLYLETKPCPVSPKDGFTSDPASNRESDRGIGK
jgi:hypothetical protein